MKKRLKPTKESKRAYPSSPSTTEVFGPKFGGAKIPLIGVEDEPDELLEEQFQTPLSRFDLEQRIMNCWNVVNDIQALVEEIKDKNLSEEELIKILSGLDSVYNMKFNNMFDCFEKLVKADKIF